MSGEHYSSLLSEHRAAPHPNADATHNKIMDVNLSIGNKCTHATTWTLTCVTSVRSLSKGFYCAYMIVELLPDTLFKNLFFLTKWLIQWLKGIGPMCHLSAHERAKESLCTMLQGPVNGSLCARKTERSARPPDQLSSVNG